MHFIPQQKWCCVLMLWFRFIVPKWKKETRKALLGLMTEPIQIFPNKSIPKQNLMKKVPHSETCGSPIWPHFALGLFRSTLQNIWATLEEQRWETTFKCIWCTVTLPSDNSFDTSKQKHKLKQNWFAMVSMETPGKSCKLPGGWRLPGGSLFFDNG